MTTPLSDRIAASLARLGHKSFRALQEDICGTLIDGGDVFAILPTGGGKSLLYQLPALVRPGTAIVVSPLIALMQDQVEALRRKGIAAATLNSTLERAEESQLLDEVKAGRIKLLYVSPEKAASPLFRDMVSKLEVALVAVDEAHCIAHMGHEFRPEYRDIAALREVLDAGVPWIAVTATADPETKAEIVECLQLAGAKLVQASFARPNIAITAAYRGKDSEAVRRILGVSRAFPEGAGIVYCTARATCERVAADLVRAGVPAVAYHAQMDFAHRKRVVELFVTEKRIVVVATIAFGMGIDRPDVRWVVHHNLPKSPEAYSQEIGRAGRDGLPSLALLLWGMRDVAMLGKFAGELKDRALRARAKARVESMRRLASEERTCRSRTLLAHYHEVSGDCGKCDVCRGSFDAVLAATAPARGGPPARFVVLDRLRAGLASMTAGAGQRPSLVMDRETLGALAVWWFMYGGLAPRPPLPRYLARANAKAVLAAAGYDVKASKASPAAH